MAEDRPRWHEREDVRELTDPRQLRALSHPLRMTVLDVLSRSDEPLTATQIGDRVGESSSSMSYHLRQLAKYGFVEEAPEAGTGRERPWRKTTRGMSWPSSRDDTPGYDTAARELMHLVIDRYFRRIETWLRHEPDLPPAWRQAAGTSDDRIFVTPDELHEIESRLVEVLRPYERTDPADRPADARPISMMLFAIPYVDEFDELTADDEQ